MLHIGAWEERTLTCFQWDPQIGYDERLVLVLKWFHHLTWKFTRMISLQKDLFWIMKNEAKLRKKIHAILAEFNWTYIIIIKLPYGFSTVFSIQDHCSDLPMSKKSLGRYSYPISWSTASHPSCTNRPPWKAMDNDNRHICKTYPSLAERYSKCAHVD